MNKLHYATTVACAGLALLGLAGCGASHSTTALPKTVVTLSNDVTGSTLPATTVTLRAHESFAVQHLVSAQPKAWTQASAGDPRIIGRGASIAVSPCPKETAGCGTPTDDVYTAKAAGTTTIVWSFGSVLPCSPSDSPVCARVTKTIRVVVR
jgi:hypothetical protein